MTNKLLVGTAAQWSCHTPNLLTEALCNPGMSIMNVPFNIFGKILAQVAQRAIELDDPAMNILMLRLTLYEVADLELHTDAARDAAFKSQEARLTN